MTCSCYMYMLNEWRMLMRTKQTILFIIFFCQGERHNIIVFFSILSSLNWIHWLDCSHEMIEAINVPFINFTLKKANEIRSFFVLSIFFLWPFNKYHTINSLSFYQYWIVEFFSPLRHNKPTKCTYSNGMELISLFSSKMSLQSNIMNF